MVSNYGTFVERMVPKYTPNPNFHLSKKPMNSKNSSGMLADPWLLFFADGGSWSVHDFFQSYSDHQQDEEHPEGNGDLATNVTHRHEIPRENSARKSSGILMVTHKTKDQRTS